MAARAGRASVLLLTGGAGCGKSTLIDYAVERADGMTVARATGVAGEAEISFAGLVSLSLPFLSLLDRLPAPQARALRVALAREESGTLERLAVGAGVLSLLAAAAEEQPVLVMVDDFHWLDQVSAQAILFAARRLASDSAAFVFAARDGEVLPVDLDGLPRLVVGDLDRGETAELAAHVHHRPLPAATVDRIHAVTRGNPLAICEMTDLAQLETPAGAVGISDIVEELYARRTAALSESAQAAIVLLAADEEASLATVERALPRVGSERSALDELEAARLVTVSASRIWFRHPLVRAAVYQRASPDERRRAHAALAAELDDGVEHDRAVLHRAAATVGTDDALARELSAVAAAATARHGYAAAAVALERAAELASGPAQAAYLHAAAAARWDAGDSVHAQRLADAALARGPGPALRADIQALRAHLLSRGGRPREAFALLIAEGEAVVPVDRERAVAMFDTATGVGIDFGMRDAIATASVLEQATAATPSRLRPLALAAAGRYPEAIPLWEQDLAERCKQPAPDLAVIADVTSLLGRYGEAYEVAIEAMDAARRAGSPLAVTKAAQVVQDMALVAGDLAAAAAYAEEGLTIARETGQGLFVAWDAWTMGVIAGVRGDVETLEHALAVLAPFDPPPAWGAVRDGAAAVRGAYLLATGQPADAAAVLETTVDLEAAQIGNMPLVAPFDLAEAHLRAADVRSYERVLDQLATRSQQPWALMALDRTRGLGASPAHGDALFERALASCEHHDMVLEHARTRVLYGEWLRRQRRRLDARHQLRSALADLEAMGAGPLAARAAAELAASGETHVVRRDRAPVDVLTPRELRVATLATEGLTNREIAQRLFLSPKTIEAHLRSVYLTLGIRRRHELADALRARAAPTR